MIVSYSSCMKRVFRQKHYCLDQAQVDLGKKSINKLFDKIFCLYNIERVYNLFLIRIIMKGNTVTTAFKQSIPLIGLHIPLGLVCGILFMEHGYPWYVASIFSFFAFAAAMQFLMLSIIAAGGSIFLMAISIIPLGIRNVFYGLTSLKRYEPASPLLRVYLAHTLIDGIYSVLQAGPRFEGKQDIRYCLWLSIFAHSTWVLGTLLGSIAAQYIAFPPKLEFSLAAFFAAAVFEVFLQTRQIRPLLLALCSLLFAWIFTPNYLIIGGLTVALVGIFFLPITQKKETA
ncbi:MAG: AzlC family ABC transporter permease [Chlamydiales bacterium]